MTNSVRPIAGCDAARPERDASLAATFRRQAGAKSRALGAESHANSNGWCCTDGVLSLIQIRSAAFSFRAFLAQRPNVVGCGSPTAPDDRGAGTAQSDGPQGEFLGRFR